MYCHICLENYNTINRIPKNLNCGHTFCDRCLKKIGGGNSYDIECPKCRQKSRNNLPICYAIYDQLLLDSKADIDEPCIIHPYERLQFYCNTDGKYICSLCLCYLHQSHNISSLKDKIQADDNIKSLNKWKDYFTYKREEYSSKHSKLLALLKELE